MGIYARERAIWGNHTRALVENALNCYYIVQFIYTAMFHYILPLQEFSLLEEISIYYPYAFSR